MAIGEAWQGSLGAVASWDGGVAFTMCVVIFALERKTRWINYSTRDMAISLVALMLKNSLSVDPFDRWMGDVRGSRLCLGCR